VLFPRAQQPQQPARVVVTGAGVVTALGVGWEPNAAGFRQGRCAIRPVTLFDVSRQRCRLAAEVDLPLGLPRAGLLRKNEARMDRAARLLVWAASEAWSQAGWTASDRLPLVLGTTSGGMARGEEYVRQITVRPGSDRRQASRMVHYHAQQQALDVCALLGFQGPITIISNACASGANAIGHGFELIRRGQAQQVLVGGYDALCQLTFAGFDSLQAMSASACRPFDAARNGLSLGEGAAVLALESLEQAHARRAEILGEVIGYGTATDIHHLTQPHPRGDAAVAAMTLACRCAGIGPEQVDYVNAHGTATVQNDAAEAEALWQWAGTRVESLPVSSTKASIGHLLGAAGAVEAAVCLMALRGQWLPPERSLESPDPVCRFPLVREPIDARLQIALSNSFGFGGANATLIFRRWA